MPSVPFVRGLEGMMRLRANNIPLPKEVRGFRSPIPPPPPGAGIFSRILKLLKYGAGLPGLALNALLLLLDAKPVSDGTLPPWITDTNNQETIQDAKYPFTGGQSNVLYEIRSTHDQRGIGSIPNTFTYNRDGCFIGSFQGPIKKIEIEIFGVGDRYRIIAYEVGNPNSVTAEFIAGSFQRIVENSIKLFVKRKDQQPDTGGNPAPIKETIVSARTPIPTPKPEPQPEPSGNELPAPPPFPWRDFFPQPNFVPDQAPIRIPQPVELPDPAPIPVPEPKPATDPKPLPKPLPEPTPDPQPKKKYRKITTYIPSPPSIIESTKTNKPPIVLDKTPDPIPTPKPVEPPKPIQTPVDKCADHCGSKGGSIDIDLSDDPDLAAIKDKLDELEKEIKQTLSGSIEVGSCEIPENNDSKEIEYQADSSKTITYQAKALVALHTAVQGLDTKLSAMHQGICVSHDVPSAIPEWWQVRAGSDRPQLVVIYKSDRSYWSMAIPWYRGKFKERVIELMPSYTRGSYATILTLDDNSKVVINAVSKAEGEKVMARLKAIISSSVLKHAELKSGGERKGKQLKSVLVKPAYAKYFAHGQQDRLPDWRYNFKTKKFTKYDRADA